MTRACATCSKSRCARPANWRARPSRGEFKSWTKGDDNSPVSEADIAVNESAARTALRARARFRLAVGGNRRQSAGLTAAPTAWIVDPIDGTRAYIAGRPTGPFRWRWSRTAARSLAALYAPVTRRIVPGRRRRRRTLNGIAMPATAGDVLAGAVWPDPSAISTAWQESSPTPIAASRRSIRSRSGSPASRMARLMPRLPPPGSHDWDLAAADLLVHEAGGLMTDLTGQSLRYNQSHTVHGALIAAGACPPC